MCVYVKQNVGIKQNGVHVKQNEGAYVKQK